MIHGVQGGPKPVVEQKGLGHERLRSGHPIGHSGSKNLLRDL